MDKKIIMHGWWQENSVCVFLCEKAEGPGCSQTCEEHADCLCSSPVYSKGCPEISSTQPQLIGPIYSNTGPPSALKTMAYKWSYFGVRLTVHQFVQQFWFKCSYSSGVFLTFWNPNLPVCLTDYISNGAFSSATDCYSVTTDRRYCNSASYPFNALKSSTYYLVKFDLSCVCFEWASET